MLGFIALCLLGSLIYWSFPNRGWAFVLLVLFVWSGLRFISYILFSRSSCMKKVGQFVFKPTLHSPRRFWKQIPERPTEIWRPDMVVARDAQDSLSWLPGLLQRQPLFQPHVHVFETTDDSPCFRPKVSKYVDRITRSPSNFKALSFLHHIVEHYDELSPVTIFVEGDVDVFYSWLQFDRLVRHRWNSHKDGIFGVCGFPTSRWTEWTERVFGEDLQNRMLPGHERFASLCLTRETIHRRPKEWYADLLERFAQEPEFDLFLANSWPLVFGLQRQDSLLAK